jgi:hypothetical protein
VVFLGSARLVFFPDKFGLWREEIQYKRKQKEQFQDNPSGYPKLPILRHLKL